MKTNKPRPGPQCSPVVITSKPAKAGRIEIVSDGALRLRLGDGNEKEIVIKPTKHIPISGLP